MILGSFDGAELTDAQAAQLAALGTAARGDILKMTTLAASGHPGGSMSSLEFLLVLWGFGNCDPKNPFREDRDRVVISHGHFPAQCGARAARVLRPFPAPRGLPPRRLAVRGARREGRAGYRLGHGQSRAGLLGCRGLRARGDQGWIAVIKMGDPNEVSAMMDAATYRKFIEQAKK